MEAGMTTASNFKNCLTLYCLISDLKFGTLLANAGSSRVQDGTLL